MKTCPICGARAFDDAAVCYGCLHRFADEEVPYLAGERTDGLPVFLIRLKAMPSGKGEYRWICEVETEDMTASAAA